jgi:hypothetical protein
LPVARIAHLLLQDPVGALHHSRIVGGNSSFTQGEEGVGCIPHRRHARLHAERIAFFDAELFKFIESADHLGIVEGISLAAQSDDGVHDRGINCAEAVAHLEAFEHPFLGLFQRDGTQRPDVYALKPVRQAIKTEKEIAPRNQLFRPAQVHARFLHAAHE